ncbi:TVP38/TMEM64 family protein [Corynebacterium sp. H128]|uniref:TVP38/TMEM64 family protein n=1 Tax=unclassified Corynebacterium TaxID=2624378 RepID=UPI003097CE87
MQTPRPTYWRFVAFGAFLIVGIILALTVELPSLEQLRRWTSAMGPWALLGFFALYVVITQFPIPRTALTVSAGVLFGPALGICLALSATTTAAFLSITLLRALLGTDTRAGSWTERLATKHRGHKAMTKINARLASRGWLSIFSLRLIPGIPFSVLNYAASFTPVKRRDFTIATLFGSAPSTVIGVLLGDSLTSGSNSLVAVLLGCLVAAGFLGLLLDILLPVKPSE